MCGAAGVFAWVWVLVSVCVCVCVGLCVCALLWLVSYSPGNTFFKLQKKLDSLKVVVLESNVYFP